MMHRLRRYDVLALLEMMLRALHANDVVPAAQMKKSKSCDLDFLVHPFKIDPYKAIVQKQSVLVNETYVFVLRKHQSIFDLLFPLFFVRHNYCNSFTICTN